MSRTSISNVSDVASEETNVTGQTTPILTLTPSSGTMLTLLAAIAKGEESGFPIYADLRDGSDDALPVDTELILQGKRPTDDEPVAISVKESNIAAWNQLDLADQRNEDYIDQVKIELKAARANIRDVDELYVSINSSAAIDWSNSELYFDREAVEKGPVQG